MRNVKFNKENVFVLLFFLCQLFVAYCSYLGKGFVLAPPKTVWDAVRNPRTRFTYDDTLKVNLSTYTLVSKLIICLGVCICTFYLVWNIRMKMKASWNYCVVLCDSSYFLITISIAFTFAEGWHSWKYNRWNKNR